MCTHVQMCMCGRVMECVCVLCAHTCRVQRLTVRSSWVTLHPMYWFRVSHLNPKLASGACLARQLALGVPCPHFPCMGTKDQYWGPCGPCLAQSKNRYVSVQGIVGYIL